MLNPKFAAKMLDAHKQACFLEEPGWLHVLVGKLSHEKPGGLIL